MSNHSPKGKKKLQYKNPHIIVHPVQFGVLKTPVIESVCLSEQQREAILQREWKWILDHKS